MSQFIDYLHEVLAPLGAVHMRRMFGGHGVYHDGLMFAIVVDEVLYLKADAQSAPAFEREGLRRFEYLKHDKPVQMSFFEAPDAMFDDPDEAARWARFAFEAALRSHASRAD